MRFGMVGSVAATLVLCLLVTASSSGASWPASYTDGPLGANEVLPNATGGVLLSLWTGVAGNTETQQRALLQQRITDMGRSPDVIGFKCSGNCSPGTAGLDVSSSNLAENWIHSKGAVPFVTWNPGSSDFTAIAAGRYDSQINAAAQRFKTFGHRIMVRMFQEFNLNSWTPSAFVSAWQHIVNRFKADGASNVGFVWCPTEQANTTTRAQIRATYPGDSYVDWVSSDSYNWDENGAYSATRPGWNEFSWIFNYQLSGMPSMEQEWRPTKPFFVSETGTKYDTAGVPSGHTVDPNRKANWYRNIPSAVASMPYLIGVQFFDQDVTKFEGNDWRVDHDQPSSSSTTGPFDSNTYQGFLDMSHATAFNSGVAGGS
jgi:hypothetical protein